MNDVMNVVHVIHVHGYDYGVHDDQMNEVNVIDVQQDVDFVVDVYIVHIQNVFHHRNVDDNFYYKTEVLLLFFEFVLIVDLN